MFAAVAVHADYFYQRIEKVKEMGYREITVEGEYHFYNHVGFKISSEFGIYL